MKTPIMPWFEQRSGPIHKQKQKIAKAQKNAKAKTKKEEQPTVTEKPLYEVAEGY